jgi:hypothetical protein
VLEIYRRQAEANPARFAGQLLDATTTAAAIFRQTARATKAHDLQTSQLDIVERLLRSCESPHIGNDYAGLSAALATVAHQSSQLDRHAEAATLCERALKLGKEAESVNISIPNPCLQLFLAATYLNRGNAVFREKPSASY